MKKPVDPVAFGARVRERRLELDLSQEELGAAIDNSQSNIGWIESGGPKRPQRYAPELAEALQTTTAWLLWKEGPKQAGPAYLSSRQLIEKYEALSPEFKAAISKEIENIDKKERKRRSAG